MVYIDPNDGMVYRSGTFGPVLVGKAHCSYEEGDDEEDEEPP